MSEQVKEMSASEKKKEDWMNSKWRPMMGWSYMLTCIADFVIFPVLWSVLQSVSKGQVNIQWQPITLQGAGLYHIAMGAVLGIAAYGRTQEKLGGANNGGINLPANVGTTYTPPGAVGQQSGGNFGAPVATTVTQTFGQPQSMGGGFGQSNNRSFGAQSSGGFGNNQAPVVTGFGGKPGPVLPPDEEL
jgi:Holin of 3TMs, for gene-transfer release